MNNRIRELAKTAGFSPFDSQGELVEKFAELIIQDCLSVAIDEVQYHAGWDVADLVVKRIKEYFGIKW